MANKTWELVQLPEGRKALGSKWVFRIKQDAHGIILKFKACLMAQGFSQCPGVDFDEDRLYAPVIRSDTMRILWTIATILNLHIHQIDIVGAYLNGKLKEEIYMKQPPGFEQGENLFCRLHMSIYGLKQSGNSCNMNIHDVR